MYNQQPTSAPRDGRTSADAADTSQSAWYALRTRSRFEKMVHLQLTNKGYNVFLPLIHTTRQWSDRKRAIDLPLFPGYIFCNFDCQLRRDIIVTPGVVEVVGVAGAPAPIPESEIHDLQTMMQSGCDPTPWPYLQDGEAIQVVDGPLVGTCGYLVKAQSSQRLVISISLLQRSVSVAVRRQWVRRGGRCARKASSKESGPAFIPVRRAG